MTITMIIGRRDRKRPKSQILYQIISEKLKQGQTGMLLLVPEQFTLGAEQALVEAAHLPGLIGVDVLSFGRLATRVFSKTGGLGRTVVDDHGRGMLLTKSVLEQEEALSVYHKSARKHGFIANMSDFIAELQENNVSADDLDALCEQLPENSLTREKLSDTAKIYAGYTDSLGEERLDETARAHFLAKQILKTADLRDSDIFIDGFHTFSMADFSIIEALAQVAENITMTLDYDPDPAAGDAMIFDIAGRTYRRMAAMANAFGYEFLVKEQPDPKDKGGIDALSHELFADAPRRYKGTPKDVRLYEASDSYEEAERAALEIVHLTRDKGLSYSDIQVFVGDPQAAGSTIARAFAMYDIPCFVDRREPVTDHPLVTHLLSALGAVRYHFGGDSVMLCAKSAYSPLGDAVRMDLCNYAVVFGISGGKWRQPFNKNDRDNTWDLDALEAGRQALMTPLVDLEKALHDGKTYREKLTAVVAYLDATGVGEKLDAMTDAQMNAGNYEGASMNNQIWNILMTVCDQIALVLGDRPCDLREFIDVFTAGIQTYQVGILPERRDVVTISDAFRGRTSGCKVAMILGANEGVLPKDTAHFPVLSDRERATAAKAGLELTNDNNYQYSNQLYSLYKVITSVTGRLYISYAMTDDEGKALRPSMIITRIRAICPDMVVHSRLSGAEKDPLFWVTGSGGTVSHLHQEEDGAVSEMVEAAMNQATGREKLPALFSHQNALTPATARALYASPLTLSITRVEQFAACPFSHFVQFGLKPVPIVPYEVTPPDIGNVMHRLLEMVFNRLSAQGRTVDTLTDRELSGLVDMLMRELLSDAHDQVFNSSGRFRYQGRKMQRVGKGSLLALAKQMTKGAFDFRYAERHFGDRLTLPDNEPIRVRGTIDRIDTFTKNDRTYIKVIDYKTGGKDISPTEVYYGISLQLAVYLAESLKLFEDEGIAIPAGAFYFHVDDPMVSGDALKSVQPEAVADAWLKAYKMNGIFLDDDVVLNALDEDKRSTVFKKSAKRDKYTADEMAALLAFVQHKIVEAAEKMLSGDIAIAPYQLDGVKPCDFCDKKDTCNLDSQVTRCRVLTKKDKDVFLDEMQHQSDADNRKDSEEEKA